jgi:hypothetical protein
MCSIAVTLLGGPDPAGGDERNADVEACADKQPGDPCQRLKVEKKPDGEAEPGRVPGVCRTDRCCSLDYSKGSPPQSVCDDCLVCKAGAPDREPSDRASAGGEDAAQVEPPRAGDGADPPAAAPNGRGCRIAPTPAGGLGLGLGLVVLALRRRRAR